MSDWQEKTLGDLVTFQRGHDLSQKQFKDGKYPIVGSNGIIGYHNEFTTKKPGITIGRSGNIGNPFYLEEDFWAHNTTLYVKEFHGSHPKFIYYLLKTFNFQNLNSGSAVPSLNRNYIHPYPVYVPEHDEQVAIAAILTCLDRKIENLRRQNETLEAIAQTLFKHWFIDFEFPNADGKPYKSSGGAMERSELGEIPAGWRVGKLGEIYKTTSGGTPSRKQPEYYTEASEGFLWVKSKELYQDFILDTEEKITSLGLQESSAKRLPEKTVLIAMYGATVGQVAILGTEATCNQAICAVLEQDYSNYFVYLWLKHKHKEWTGMAIGSAQQNLSQVLISKIEMVIPSLDLNVLFNRAASPIFHKMLINSKQIQTLTQTRDVLLPKLMSGKLRIRA